MVSFEDLCANLTAYLQRSVQDIVLKGTDENRIASALQNLEEVVALLPKLEQGLDINVRFTDPLAMEFTSALALFDLCNIRLVHGWCYDQQDIETKRVIGTMSYNELVSWIMMEAMAIEPAPAPQASPSSSAADSSSASASSSSSSIVAPASDVIVPTAQVASSEASVDAAVGAEGSSAAIPAVSAEGAPSSEAVPPEAPASSPNTAVAAAASSNELPSAVPVLSDDEKSARLAQQLSDRNVARGFLDSSPSQLTIAGLAALHEVMKEDELAVLFRNNHFSVLYKRNTGRLYTLITDAGIISSAPYVVWSYQSTTEGDHLFLDHDWKIPHPQTVAYYASLPNNRLSVPLAQPQHHNHSPIPQASPVTPSLQQNSPNPQAALQPVMATPISDPSAPPMPAGAGMPHQVPLAIPISHAQPVQAPSGGAASSFAFASPSAAETLAANRKFAAENGLIWNEVTQNFEQPPPPPQQQQQHHQPYQQQNPQGYRQPVHVSDRVSRPGEKEKKKKDSCVVQ